VRPLVGVRGIANELSIVARADAEEISQQICAALERHVTREARNITVSVEGGVVTLSGKVDSLPEHDAAIGTAFGSKGVTQVVDRLEVAS
jgi:osmotically-inducible protein OsmY